MKIRRIAFLTACRLLCTRLKRADKDCDRKTGENKEGEKHRLKGKRRKLRKYANKDTKERKSR